MILEIATLVGILIKVGTDIGTAVENNIINAAIDAVTQKQQPSLTELGWSVSGLQREQRKQIEERYKTGKDLLNSARRTGKEEYRIELIRDAINAFIAAKNLESGEAAARAALLAGACFHLLYCIDDQYGIRNENFWYKEAFRLAEQSRGSDGKPPRELIRELLGLPYLSGKYGTFEVYWQKWDPPKRIEPPKSPLDPIIRGSILYRHRRYEGALVAYEQAIRLNPNNASAYMSKGDTLNNLMRYEEALAAYEQAIRLNPNNASAYMRKGDTLNNLKRDGEAQAAYGQAFRMRLDRG